MQVTDSLEQAEGALTRLARQSILGFASGIRATHGRPATVAPWQRAHPICTEELMSRSVAVSTLALGLISGLAFGAVPSTQSPYSSGAVLSAEKLNADFADIETRLAAAETASTLADAQAMRAVDFKTTESATGGTWIDGKPIYRRVLPFTGAPPTTGEKDVAIGLTPDTVVSVRGMFEIGGESYPLPFTDSRNDLREIGLFVSGSNVRLQGGGQEFGAGGGYIVIEYTKP